MQSISKNNVYIIAVFSLLFPSISLFSQIQPNQDIWYHYCVASPDTSCFEPSNGAVETVGRDVAALEGDFRICLQVDTIDSGYAPIRVIITLDRSGSMCTHYGVPNSEDCCVQGDGSGYCSKNDPYNKRVEAAHVFVDSLRMIAPESEIGVIIFSSSPQTLIHPTPLTDAADVAHIHSAIDAAGCDTTAFSSTLESESIVQLAKTSATKTTNLGRALILAMDEADYHYSSMSAFMTRHIILLTDGAWDDALSNSPTSIINNYTNSSENTGRAIPTIHGVFLSDSITHVTHGYPAHGCAQNDSVEISNLHTAANLSGGLFFGGSTPETVVKHFMTLLDSVTQTAPQRLGSLEVTNTTNGEISSNGPIRQIGVLPTYETTLESLPIEFGSNVLNMKWIVQRPEKSDSTVSVTVTVVRSEAYRETVDTDLFLQYCELDNASITINAQPETQNINSQVNVGAIISNRGNFSVSQSTVRLLTGFPDSDNSTLATFHLDGTLDNATGGSAGTGTPGFTTSSALFGKGALSGGHFRYSIPTLTDAFLLEEWVYPSSGPAVLISGGGVEFGVNANNILYFKNNEETLSTSEVPLDLGVWTHVAVARQSGTIVLFVNGSAVSMDAAYSSPISGGPLTFNIPNRWIVDEIRISSASRMTTNGAERILTMSIIQNPQWVLLETPSIGATLTVPATTWINGTTLDFSFSSPISARVIVNIRQAQSGSNVGTGWSKNSNPVLIAADQEGPYVEKGILTPVSDGYLDTLLIKFNEPVLCDSLMVHPNVSKSFIFLTADGKSKLDIATGASYIDQCPAGTYSNEIELAVPVGIEPGSDSILLTGEVVDKAGNKPPEENKKGPVIWGEGKGIKIIPIDGGPSLKIDAATKSITGTHEEYGKIITIKVVVPLQPIDTVGDTISFGEATIYDAVGNIIASKITVMKIDDENRAPRSYYIVWNGENRNGRRVGPGSYYVHFNYRFVDGKSGSEGKKFHLKRKYTHQ